MAWSWFTKRDTSKERRKDEDNKKEDWRSLPPDYKEWNDETCSKLRKELTEKIKPNKEPLLVLMTGNTGAGKSTQINSFNTAISTVSDEIDSGANTAFNANHVTSRYMIFQAYEDEDNTLPLWFADWKGDGIKTDDCTDDIIKAIEGCLEVGAKFASPDESLNREREQQPSATFEYINEGRAHFVCFVCHAQKLRADITVESAETVREKYKGLMKIKAHAKDLNIPSCLILTHCDVVDSAVKRNIRNIYRSKEIKEVVDKASEKLSFSVNRIFPVANPVEEVYGFPGDVSLHLLLVLQIIIKDALKATRRSKQMNNTPLRK